MLFALMDELKDWRIEEHEQARDSAELPRDRLKAILKRMVCLTIDNRARIRVQPDNFNKLPEELQKILGEKTHLSERIVADELDRPKGEGVMRELNTNLVTYTLYGMTNRGYSWYDPNG